MNSRHDLRRQSVISQHVYALPCCSDLDLPERAGDHWDDIVLSLTEDEKLAASDSTSRVEEVR